MFKTYDDKLHEIEALYNGKDYESTIVESAKLTEKALYAFFNQFHSFLTTKDDWNKYLAFEKQNGDRYAAFLKRPTIGVAIGYYSSLLDLFPGHFGLTPEIKRYLNQINQIRNSNLHAAGGKATDEEAASILDSLEKILNSTNLNHTSIDVVGIPIKYWLVYKSIREKFEISQSEDDFRKIVSDSIKILPGLLNVFLNKIYRDLSFDKKETLIQLFNKTADNKKENTLAYYIQLCLSIDIQNTIEQGHLLKDSLEFIANDAKEGPLNRRQTRHYVSALEIIAGHTDNPETSHFLDFADSVKKKYLIKHSLSGRDKIILEEKANELSISKDLALRIEESVIQTIEKELILFQTLTVEAPAVANGTVAGPKPMSKIQQLKWYWLVAAALIPVSILSIWYYGSGNKSGYADYEIAYYSFDTKKALQLIGDARPLNDVKANFFYILASYFNNNSKFPPETVQEYRHLYNINPTSGPANLYLGLIYSYEFILRDERDSCWILINNAEKLGVRGMELLFAKENFFRNAGLPEFQLEIAKELEKIQNPRTKSFAASIYKEYRHDTAKSISLYKDAIAVYPSYLGPYLQLSDLFVQRKKYDSAKLVIQKALDVNPKDAQLISAMANILKQEGRFDLATKLFRTSLEDFGSNDLRMQTEFVLLLFMQDSINEALNFVDSALVKFPKDRDLVAMRAQLLNRQKTKKLDADKIVSSLTWLEDIEEGKKKARQTGAPILLNIYAPWSYWTHNLERSIFPDNDVVGQVAPLVRVKINGTANTAITKKYDVRNLPTLLILDQDGRKVGEVGKYRNKEEFSQSLASALNLFNVLKDGNDPSKRFTQVNNFNDAEIIARTKRIPIMLLVGDDRSEYTNRIINESFKHPLFKPASQNMVYLYINKDSDDPVLGTVSPKTYPTIYFMSPDRKILQEVAGFQPGDELAKLTLKVKEFFNKGTPLPPRINWFYDQQEALAYSLIAKKNIYEYFYSNSCGDCEIMEKTFGSKEVVKFLDNNYICLKVNVDTQYGMDLLSGTRAWYWPFNFILNENGTELFSKYGYMDTQQLQQWLTIQDRLRLLSTLGFEKSKQFISQNSLAKNCMSREGYQSAINILLEQKELVPDYGDIDLDLATCYRKLKQGELALNAYDQALKKTSLIPFLDLHGIPLTFILLNKLESAPEWIDVRINKTSSPVQKANLLLAKSYAYEYLGDYQQAESAARQCVNLNPKEVEGWSQLAKVQIRGDRLAEAVRTIAAFETQNDVSDLATYYKGIVAEKSGNKQTADNLFKTVSESSTSLAWRIAKHDLCRTTNYYNYPTAVRSFNLNLRDAIKIDQTTPWPRNTLALSYLIEGNTEEALNQTAKGIELSPDPNFKITRSLVLLKQNKTEAASALISEIEKNLPEDFLDSGDNFTLALNDLNMKREKQAKERLMKAANYRNAEGITEYFKNEAKELLNQLEKK